MTSAFGDVVSPLSQPFQVSSGNRAYGDKEGQGTSSRKRPMVASFANWLGSV